ncbi:MAG: hypothetical protein ACK4N5_08275, partial [Myxococcales bacterium]
MKLQGSAGSPSLKERAVTLGLAALLSATLLIAVAFFTFYLGLQRRIDAVRQQWGLVDALVFARDIAAGDEVGEGDLQ